MFQKIYGLGKVKFKIKWPGRLEKTQIQQKTLKKLISGFTPYKVSTSICYVSVHSMSDLYIHVCITVSHILKRANFISKCHNRPRVSFFIQKCYKMHFGVRLHGQNACYVIFWNIAPKHWIYILLLFMTLYLLGICY